MNDTDPGDIITLVRGDITEQDVDAIVNAANSTLLGGGGVDGAIHRNGGPAILEECRAIRNREYPGGLPTGLAVSTTAGRMAARRVIHTVGPVWQGGRHDEERHLANAYRNSLQLAKDECLRTIAFPSISTGAYGFPIRKAARIAFKTVRDWLAANANAMDEVRFVLFSEADYREYRQAEGD